MNTHFTKGEKQARRGVEKKERRGTYILSIYPPRRILAPGTEHFQTRCSAMIGGGGDGADVDWSEWSKRLEEKRK